MYLVLSNIFILKIIEVSHANIFGYIFYYFLVDSLGQGTNFSVALKIKPQAGAIALEALVINYFPKLYHLRILHTVNNMLTTPH